MLQVKFSLFFLNYYKLEPTSLDLSNMKTIIDKFPSVSEMSRYATSSELRGFFKYINMKR